MVIEETNAKRFQFDKNVLLEINKVNTMNNVMLDLETMGNGSNAAIIAIGACY